MKLRKLALCAILAIPCGWISFGFATAPDDNPKRRWKDLRWDYANVTVQVGNWTRRTNPSEKAIQSDAAQIAPALSELGTYIYANPL